jgi:transcriptional regulator with XRE-family HTH domain
LGPIGHRLRHAVSRSYLSQIEKGVFFASLKIVGKLAKALDVEPAELLKLPPKRGR